MSEWNKADFLPYAPGPATRELRPWADIEADLSRDIWPGLFETKDKKNSQTGGKTTIPFVGWATVKIILDKYVPGWSQRLETHMSLDGVHVTCVVTLLIPTSDRGVIERPASGSANENEKEYGTASDRAESKAFRRAAAKFGVGFRLYHDKQARQQIVRWKAQQDGGGGTQQQQPRPVTQPAQAQKPIQQESRVQSNGAQRSNGSQTTTAPSRGIAAGAVSADDPALQKAWADFNYVAPLAGYETERAQIAYLRSKYPNCTRSTLTAADLWTQSTALRAALGMEPHPASGAVELEAVGV